MKSFLFAGLLMTALFVSLGAFHFTRSSTTQDAALSDHGTFVEITESDNTIEIDPFENWQRPDEPTRVGLQVGHWKNKELPEEFERLRETGGGTSGGGKTEWEVNLAIAELTAQLLEEKGVVVDILPATVPPDYWADAFIAIHADGNDNASVSGYKVAAPRRDRTGSAEQLASFLEEEYKKTTNLTLDSNITRNMTGYYAFNWRRYEHSMHPMAAAAIIETGFLTNPQDRKIIANAPETSAEGIANGILAFLQSKKLAMTRTTVESLYE